MSFRSPAEAFIFLMQETTSLAQNHRTLDKPQVEYLEQFRASRLVPIYQREIKARQSPFTLCLVGLTNVGKSTLIEALIGAAVAPQKNGPATAIPVEYSFSPSWRLEVHHHDAGTPLLRLQFPTVEELAAEVSRHVIAPSNEAAQRIAAVSVKGPMDLLKNQLVLADTPGIGAAQTSPTAAGAPHSTPPDRWLENSGRAYLCVAAGVGWKVSPEETAFYRSLRHVCSNIIITKWEDDEAAQKEWKTEFAQLFPGAGFVFVNARRDVNVSDLRQIIQAQSSVERRLLQVRRELLKAWDDLKGHFQQVYKVAIPWRPDSLLRFQHACSTYAELHAITSELKAPCLT